MFYDYEPIITQLHGIIRVYNGRPKGQIAHYGNRLSRNELIYKWCGSSILKFGSHTFELKQGAVLYLPKGDINGEYLVETINQGDAIDILYDSFQSSPAEPRLIDMNEYPVISSLFDRVHREWLSSHASRYSRCLSLSYQIIAEIKEYEARHQRPPMLEALLQPAIDYMDQHCFDRYFDYQKMASSTGVGYSYFKRIFIHKYGMPPSRYITARKMTYARNLLLNPDCTITQISEQLGYDSVYYFSRVFRQEVGTSPSQYRRLQHMPQ